MDFNQLQLFTNDFQLPPIYYLLLQPNEPILSNTLQLRKQVSLVLVIKFNSRFYPHITLLQFPMSERKEFFLVNLLRKYLSNINSPLILKSDGLKVFSKQVVITILNQTNIKELVDNLEKELFIASLISNKRKSYFKTRNPHISITDKINSKFAQDAHKVLLPSFTNSEFSCNKLILLKSPTGTAPWMPVSTFLFEN